MMDCGFKNQEGWFRYRAAAIIVENGCVLMAHNELVPYYYSVGGGVHLHETTEDAVQREVLEETGVTYNIEHLAFIHENFFMDETIAQGVPCHEITLYYLMKPNGSMMINSNSYTMGVKENMAWLPIHQLEKEFIYPTFFKEWLTKLPDHVVHIVTRQY